MHFSATSNGYSTRSSWIMVLQNSQKGISLYEVHFLLAERDNTKIIPSRLETDIPDFSLRHGQLIDKPPS
jgi:hypothetical protein